MDKQAKGRQRQRKEALSRERIVAAAIELLNRGGEDGLTFPALSKRLATGPGAIYWHVANKGELLTAACQGVVARTLGAIPAGSTPQGTIRALALGVFDAMAAHPWIGAALIRAESPLPLVQIIEPLGQQVCALGVLPQARWAAVSPLLSNILGVGGQNATNRQLIRTRGIKRADYLEEVWSAWTQLDAQQYPFARSVAEDLRAHDDRADFLAGIDLIVQGMDTLRRQE